MGNASRISGCGKGFSRSDFVTRWMRTQERAAIGIVTKPAHWSIVTIVGRVPAKGIPSVQCTGAMGDALRLLIENISSHKGG